MAYEQQGPYVQPARPRYNQQSAPQSQRLAPPPQHGGPTRPALHGDDPRPYSYRGYDGDDLLDDYGFEDEPSNQQGSRDPYSNQQPRGQGGYPQQQPQHYAQSQREQYPPQERSRGYSNGMDRQPPQGHMQPGAGRAPPQNYGQAQRQHNGQYAQQPQQQRGPQQSMAPRQQPGPGSYNNASPPPATSNFDNPFPVFPVQQARPHANDENMSQAMGNMDLNRQQPPSSSGRSSAKSSASGQYNDPQSRASPRPVGDQYQHPSMDDAAGFGPPKRSFTMPENSGYAGGANRQPTRAQPGPQAGGPGGPGYRDPVPQRSFTTTGYKPDAQNLAPQRSFTNVGGRSPNQQHAQPQQQMSQSSGSTLRDRTNKPAPIQAVPRNHPSANLQVQQSPRLRESQIDAYMPNFDDSPEDISTLVDPVGLPLDNAPGIPRTGTPNSRTPDLQQGGFQKMRSQPDIRGQANPYMQQPGHHVPPMPRGASPMGAGGQYHQSSPVYGNAGYGQQAPQQSQYAMHPQDQYGYGQQQDPRAPNFQRPSTHSPSQQMHRADTIQSQWSDPGQGGGQRMGPPQGLPMRPGQINPQLGRNGQQQGAFNPDTLPAHPAPVRPGLMQDGQGMHARGQSAGYQQQGRQLSDTARSSTERRQSTGPVTHDELSRLRAAVKSNPADHKTHLTLIKKLIEASGVLADEGGRADVKTRNKNREGFILEANKMTKKLVAQQYPEGIFFLADCYGTGQLGLAVDQKEAFQLYQQAAKLGHAPSAYRTAVCCEMGNDAGGGTRRDALKAVQWYRRAAALGDVAAMYKLGMILQKGMLGQQISIGEAVIWLERAAERADEDNPHALHEVAHIYETAPAGGKIIRDEAYSFELYEKAAKHGYKLSQCRLGQAYEHGELGLPVDNRSSIHWFSKAAAQEEHEAELALSGWYLTGSAGILEANDTEAYLWARKAALAEHPKAEFAMGYFSEVGIGCPRSLDDAKRWYGRAAAHKYPKASERLEELRRGGAKVQRGRERLSRNAKNEDCVVM